MSSCRTSCYRSKKNGPTGATGSTGLIGPSGSAGVNNNTIEAVHYADLWVDKNGNNDTGTGTFANPFLTIPVALNAIVDASSAKRYVIHVGSGEFTEDINLKPWVNIIGVQEFNTVITGEVSLNTSGVWSGDDDLQTTLSHLTFTNTIELLFQTTTSNFGSIHIYNCKFEDINFTVIALSSNTLSVNHSTFIDSNIFLTNINVTNVVSTTFQGGTIANQITGSLNQPATFNAYGGTCDNFIVLSIGATNTLTINLYGFVVGGTVILNGPLINTNITADSFPATITMTNDPPLPRILTTSAGHLLTFAGGFNASFQDGLLGNVLPSPDGFLTDSFNWNYPVSPARSAQKLRVNVLRNEIIYPTRIRIFKNETIPTSLVVEIEPQQDGIIENITDLVNFEETDTISVRYEVEQIQDAVMELTGSVLLL